MTIDRRSFLKLAGAGLGGFAVTDLPKPSQPSLGPTDGMALLYDTTICVGCKACQVACKQVNGLPPETDEQGIYEMPNHLTGKTWTVIKLYQPEGDEPWSFCKIQCMHCQDPACVSVCPVGALVKESNGAVTYDTKKCFGCRYCMAACPFDIPKYEWEKNLPLIQKCNFCAARQAEGLNPACYDACPTGALTYGKRSEVIAIAEARIRDNPGRYVPHVYGKDEAGGTSMLYLSHVPFEKLGFPTLSDQPLPAVTWIYMKAVPPLIGVVGTLVTATYWFTHRKKGPESGLETGPKEESHDSAG